MKFRKNSRLLKAANMVIRLVREWKVSLETAMNAVCRRFKLPRHEVWHAVNCVS